MRICLDTSAYSAFKRGHPEILAVVQSATEIVLNAVVLGELLAGFRIGGRRGRNQEQLDAFLQSSRVRLVGLDQETSVRYAEIVAYLRREGTPIPTNDVWIAATAMQLGLCVLTTDPHFKQVPQVTTEFFDA